MDPHPSTNVTREHWSLTDLKLAIMFLRSLFMTGLAPSEALAELAKLQPRHAEFWNSAARHSQTGRSLNEYLKGRWPDNLVSPIRIAENSGRLEDVLIGMEKSLQQQIESRKLLNKLYYPIAITIGGFGAAIFFVAFVIPTMIGKMRLDKEPPIIVFAKWAQGLILEYGYMALGIALTSVAVGIWRWREDEHFRAAVFSIINRIPVLGWSTRWIWFSVWANYASIMIKADIAFTDPTFRNTILTLPPHLRPAISAVITQIDRGQSLSTAVTTNSKVDDPRSMIPIHIVNAFRMTDRSGQGVKQFQLASETLFEPGKEILSMAISTINQVMIMISAMMIVVPFGMYIKTIAGIAQIMNSAR